MTSKEKQNKRSGAEGGQDSQRGHRCCGMRFAPLYIPCRRRIQTAVVATTFPPTQMIACVAVYSYLALTCGIITRALLLAYLGFCIFDRTPARGGWGFWWGHQFFQDLSIWKYFIEYFPMKMHKTSDLDPQKNYVFAYHPHGVIPVGAGAVFSTTGLGFREAFPGIRCSLMTLKPLFQVPFFREWMLAHGNAPCGKKTCLRVLREGPGRSICLAVGGAAESLDAHPGKLEVTLKRRKGFVKVAVATGSSLVPILGYGENEIFRQVSNPRGSQVRRWQEKIRKALSFAPLVFFGRGVFQYTFGFVPFRHPVNIVIGPPIECPQEEEPSEATVNRVHAEYITALEKLHKEHGPRFAGDTPLVIH